MIEDGRGGGVAPCIIELFKRFLDSASEEDKRAIFDIIKRHAEKRGWK